MAIAKITGQGLTSIAILVALLWTCVVGERLIVRRANASAEETLRAIRLLAIKNRPTPANVSPRPAVRRLHARVG